jgi:hypothetical protein
LSYYNILKSLIISERYSDENECDGDGDGDGTDPTAGGGWDGGETSNLSKKDEHGPRS